jgi:hypothetical protein
MFYISFLSWNSRCRLPRRTIGYAIRVSKNPDALAARFIEPYRGFECGDALREAWGVVHIRIDELAFKARPSQGAAAPALTFQRPAARRGVKTESPCERQT